MMVLVFLTLAEKYALSAMGIAIIILSVRFYTSGFYKPSAVLICAGGVAAFLWKFVPLVNGEDSLTMSLSETFESSFGMLIAIGSMSYVSSLYTEYSKALQRSEEHFRSLIENSFDFITTLNPDGKMHYVSHSVKPMLGYEPEELTGRNLFTLIHPDDAPRVTKIFTEAFKTPGSPISAEYRFLHKDRLWRDLESMGKSMPDASAPSILINTRDATERKRAEEELKKHREHLEELVKERTIELMRANEEFQQEIIQRKITEEKLAQLVEKLERSNAELEQIGHIGSHNLKEPLRMVTSYVQLLERRYKGRLDPDADEFIAYASNGAKKMASMIDALLRYTNVIKCGMEFEPVDCNLVLGKALVNLSECTEKNDAAITHDTLPVVSADFSQLVQVFQNLVSNSIKFRRKENPRIHIGCEEKENEYIFRISDNGIGFDIKHAKHLFQMFTRLQNEEKYQGTGMGLAICKKIVERHGGRIWAEAEIGAGSTFYFTIPERETDLDPAN